MNIKQQYSIRQYGLPSVFSVTNILTIKDDTWYINNQPTGVSTTLIPPEPGNELHFYNNPTPYVAPEDRQNVDNYVFQENLKLLNQRINAIHKELTYWDLYKLTASVENAEDLDAVFSSLSIGQSMVINCPTFTKGGVKYSRGDVIVRTTENSEIKIDALSTGLFYPQSITKSEGNVFAITYSYFGGTPSSEAEPAEIDIDHPTEPIQNNLLPPSISFTNLTDVPGTIYGLLYELPLGATGEDYILTIDGFDILYEDRGQENNPYILPIIKCYNDEYEEISLDHSRLWITPNNGKWFIHCNADNVKNILTFVQVK